LTQSSRPCTFPNIWMKWTNILHNGQWNQLPYWLTTLSWWELLGPTHTHIHTRYVPSYHTSFPSCSLGTTIPRFEFHLPWHLTNHLQSHLYKQKAIQHQQWLQSSTKKKPYDPVGWTFCTSSYKSLAQPAHPLASYPGMTCDLQNSSAYLWWGPSPKFGPLGLFWSLSIWL
jgi:hypothetical protein